MGLTPLIFAASLAVAPAAATDHAVQLGQGEGALHGSLLRPDGRIAPAAVLMIAGSGPEDRDGDQRSAGQHSRTLWYLAQALAAQDIVSLRYDKRGVAESAAAGNAATIDQTVDEAARWVRFLERQPAVRCVVVLGHSEGALIGALVAGKVRLCGLVEVSGASRNLGDLIEAQGAVLGRSRELNAAIHDAIEAERAGRPLAEVPQGYGGVFGPGAEGYTRSEISVDPVAELARVKIPVLVVQGDNDVQANVDDARRLAAAVGVEPVVIHGMNHVLKLAPKDPGGNFMTYANPNLPLAPGVSDAIGDFVRARR